MKAYKMLICLILAFACIGFGACDIFYTPSSKTIEASGKVNFVNLGFEGVEIKTSSQVLDITSADGTFAFETNANELVIFAEKDGYVFSPRSITLTENTQNITFVAEQVKPLNGELVLTSINITPTSIATYPNDYSFSKNNSEHLKISNLDLTINSYDYQNFINNSMLLEKNSTNKILVDEEFSIKTQSKINIEFKLSAKYTSYSKEYNFEETRYTTLNISANQTTANLDDDNFLIASLKGINSSNNMFSYNIYFMFKYYPNI